MTVDDVFSRAGLTPQGPVQWGSTVHEERPGVYVVALVANAGEMSATVEAGYLSPVEQSIGLLDNRLFTSAAQAVRSVTA
jgi:hypothetical protein